MFTPKVGQKVFWKEDGRVYEIFLFSDWKISPRTSIVLIDRTKPRQTLVPAKLDELHPLTEGLSCVV